MPPAGEGANHAMLDGATLRLPIVAAAPPGGQPSAALADAVKAYEAEMFPRASGVTAKSFQLEPMGLSRDAARSLRQML